MNGRWLAAIVIVLAVTAGLMLAPRMTTSLVTWLMRPWDGSIDHTLPSWAAWHGRLMVLAWGVLSPAGIVIARYFKVWADQNWPQRLDDQRWWHLHRTMQLLAVGLASLGVYLVWRHNGGWGFAVAGLAPSLAQWHAVLGWTIMGLGWLQIVGGLLRGSKGGPTDRRAKAPAFAGDHYVMSRRRVVFEYVHKLGGYATLGLTLAVVPMGLALADGPRWMWIVIGGWWAVLALACAGWQRAGRCVDTYQAIWGPSPDLPGNRRKPVGWGVVRSRPDTFPARRRR